MKKQVADTIREVIERHNATVSELENLLREARSLAMEVELTDGTSTEISHELDGLTAFKIKVVNILVKMPL